MQDVRRAYGSAPRRDQVLDGAAEFPVLHFSLLWFCPTSYAASTALHPMCRRCPCCAARDWLRAKTPWSSNLS